jgi:hypothetical protein
MKNRRVAFAAASLLLLSSGPSLLATVNAAVMHNTSPRIEHVVGCVRREALMKRRDFNTWLDGAVTAWPLPLRARQPCVPIVTFLRSSSMAAGTNRLLGFREFQI